MDPEAFRREGHRIVDWLADYFARPERFPVLAQVAPGDLVKALPASAPETPEPFDAIFRDFESLVGGRISVGRSTSAGSWDVAYEITGRREDGFSSDRDDILQHRVRANASFFEVMGCTLSVYGQMSFFDSEAAVSAGFFLQRSF